MNKPVEADGRVALTVRVEGETAQALRESAGRHRMSVSELAAALLRESLGQMAADRLNGPALPAVRVAVEEALKPHVERLAALVARTHLEAGIGERLTYVLIAQTFGPDKAPQFLDAARTKSIEALRRPLGEQRPVESPE